MKNVLIINAHQFFEGISGGKLNSTLAGIIKQEMAARGYGMKETYIEQGYDVQGEVDKHLWADIIILQSPVFWFGMPWIYKKYVDEVFTAACSSSAFCRVMAGRARIRASNMALAARCMASSTCCR